MPHLPHMGEVRARSKAPRPLSSVMARVVEPVYIKSSSRLTAPSDESEHAMRCCWPSIIPDESIRRSTSDAALSTTR